MNKKIHRSVELSTITHIKRFALLLLVGLSTACSALSGITDMFGQGAEDASIPAALQEFSPSLSVKTEWSTNLGSALEGKRTGLRPTLYDGKIFAAGSGGSVAAFNALTGEQVWRTSTGVLLGGGPGVSGNLVVVGGYNGEAIALNAENGTEVWRKTLSSEVLSAPAVDNSYVAIKTADGRLTVLEASSGSELWFDEQEVPRLSLRGNSPPILRGGLLLSPNDNGKLLAFNPANGAIVWQNILGIPRGRTELDRLVDIDGNIEFNGTDIYVVGYQSRLGKIDGNTGRLQWAQKYSSVSGLGIDSTNIYLSDDENSVIAISQASGSELWKTADYENRQFTAPIPVGGSLVAGDLAGFVHFLSSSDGSTLQRLKLSKAPITTPPLAVSSLVYIQADDGTLVAYRVGE